MTTRDDEPVFTVKEVSNLVRTSQPAIRRLIASKKLHAMKIGGQWRITASAFQNYLKSNIRTGK